MPIPTARTAAIVIVLTCVGCSDGASISPAAPGAQGALTSDAATDARSDNTLIFTGRPGEGTGIVINEFATRLAPNEECSEFVELRNDSPHEQSLGSWRIAVSAPGLAPVLFTTIPVGVSLAPGCHLLIATAPSGLLRDVAAACNLPDNGGLALMRPNGTIADQVGMSTGSAFREGTPLKPFSGNSTRRSYARVRGDTNNNAIDFVFGAATPQNLFDDCTKR